MSYRTFIVFALFLVFSCGGDDDAPQPIEATQLTVSFASSSSFDVEGEEGNLPQLLLSGTVVDPTTVTIGVLFNESTATENEDFTFGSGQVITIPPGTYQGNSATIAIEGFSVLDDFEEENSETIQLELSNPTGDAVLGETDQTTYTILDNDGLTISFSQQTASGRESEGNNLPEVIVLGNVDADLSVEVRVIQNGSAILGTDFTLDSPQTLVIPAGNYNSSGENTFSIPGLAIIDDDQVEPAEFFELELSGPEDDLGITQTRYEIQGLTPCEGGTAGQYPCNGYDLIGRISVSDFDAVSGNDVWGWQDQTSGREFALVGLDNGTAFVEVSGDEPIYLGKLPTATGSSVWRDVKVYQDHAYVVSEAAGHGMQVFDLRRLLTVTNPPQTFAATTTYTDIGNAHNVVINEASSFAYPVGTARNDAFNGGVHFVDIQNPTAPTPAGGHGDNGYTHDAQVVTYNGPDADYAGREIFIGANEDQIAIVDITDKNNPVEIATLTYGNLGYTHQGWFTEDQRFFLLGDELDEIDFGFNSRTLVFDLQDLDNPQLHTTYLGPTGAIDHNGYVLGDEFYLANYTAGVRVLDISGIADRTISEIGFFDTFPANNTASFDGVWSVYPYLESQKILVNDSNNGFFLIRKSE